ncbi:MAG: DUF222 domain-containing protein [Acidimicrobiaceae bacterium]|nr:DUF222 domain-containing protein [Acidimicrobiaceae bacterium]
MLRSGSGSAEATPTAPQPTDLTTDRPGMLVLRRLDRGELTLLRRDELVNALGDIERLANRLAGYRAEVLGALHELSRSGVAPDPMPHLTLRDATGVSEREARRLCRVASKAREHAAVLDALAEGDINADQAESLCDARVPDEVRTELVAAAASHDTDTTRQRLREAEATHGVETPTERFLRQRTARGAGWGRDHEGMLKLWARFDPETGASIEAALEPLRRALWQDDKHQRTDRRTPAQRDADTLAYALAGATLTEQDAATVDRLHARACRDGHAEQVQRLSPAQISVLIGLDALRGHTDQAGVTDAGTELAPETVRRLACDAEIIPIILGGRGGSADIGWARRTVPLRLRRLLIARDKHCQWPGCHAPPSRCDAHHVVHWADGGPTNLDNLVLLCHTHHQHLHEHGYELVVGPDGWMPRQKAVERRKAEQGANVRQPRAP